MLQSACDTQESFSDFGFSRSNSWSPAPIESDWDREALHASKTDNLWVLLSTLHASPATANWENVSIDPQIVTQSFVHDQAPALYSAQTDINLWVSSSLTETVANPKPLKYIPKFRETIRHLFAQNANVFDRFVQDLQRLADGWDDDGAKAPSDQVISNIERAAIALSAIRQTPECYVDEDGSVTFHWNSDRRTFSLTFNGNDALIGTLSPYDGNYEPWRLSVFDEASIAEKIDDNDLMSILG